MTPLRRPDSCPRCASRRVRFIVRGLPTAESWRAIERGESIAGGCMVSVNDPDWDCADCHHRWADEDDPARKELQALLRNILRPPPPPKPPPMETASDGSLTRTWRLRVTGVPSSEVGRRDEEVSRCATELWRSMSASQECHADVIAVQTRQMKPRGFVLTITYPSGRHDERVDAAVMSAVQQICGRIQTLQDFAASMWRGWPLSTDQP